MTVSATGNRAPYTGDAVTTAFAFPYPYTATSDLKVYVDGALQGSGYSVSAAGPSGTVTFSAAPASGAAVVILRDVPKTQGINLTANDAFPAETNEAGFDRATLITQDLAAALGRTVRVADYAAGVQPLDLFANPNALIGSSGSGGLQFYPIDTGVNGLQVSDQPVNAAYMIAVVSPGTYIDNVLTIRNESWYATNVPPDGRTASRGNSAIRFTTAWKQERAAVGYTAPALGFDTTDPLMGPQSHPNLGFFEVSNLVGAGQPEGAPDFAIGVTCVAGDPFFPGTYYEPFRHVSALGYTYIRARQVGGGYGQIHLEGDTYLGGVGLPAVLAAGMSTSYVRMRERVSADRFALTTNLLDGGQQDNVAKSSWSLSMGAGGDSFMVARAPAGSGTLVDLLGATLASATFRGFKIPVVLASSAVASASASNTSEQVLATITIPAGLMGLNGRLRFKTDGTLTSSANNKTLRVRLGGLAGTAISAFTYTTTSGWQMEGHVQNRNSASSQWANSLGQRATDTVMSVFSSATAAIDTSAAVDLVITGQKATAGETFTLESYTVELLP